MSNNYLDQKNLARLAEINKTQTKQMEQFLSMNPNFQNRFEAINNMYSNLLLHLMAESKVLLSRLQMSIFYLLLH